MRTLLLFMFSLYSLVAIAQQPPVSEETPTPNPSAAQAASPPVSESATPPVESVDKPEATATPPVSEPKSPESAKPTVSSTTTVPAAITDALKRLVKESSTKIFVSPAPIPNLYEAVVGNEIVYFSADGRYIIVGDIRDLTTGHNLTDKKRGELRIQTLNEIDEKEMIVFAPKKETLHTINIFTDVNCPYCSHIHNEVGKLNDAGIKVRYLAFPRAGIGSPTYNTMVSVWCSKNPQKAITDAKAGRPVEPATCDNPIGKQYELAQRLGVNGTPALIFEDGELLPGYAPAEKLIAHLQQKTAPVSGESKELRP